MPIEAPQGSDEVIRWFECRGEAQLGDVPADVTALRCFDFTDVGIAAKVIAGMLTLEELDASYSDWFDAEVALPQRSCRRCARST